MLIMQFEIFRLNVIARSEWFCLNSIYGNLDVYYACVWWFHELLIRLWQYQTKLVVGWF